MIREHRPEPTPAPEPTSTSDVQSIAAEGVAGPGTTLPHADLIQRAFGRHNISTITAHVGGAAATASDAIGANAYASGSNVAFAAPPDLRLAAHEAAHVIQQRAGLAPTGGVGTAGDQYEHHADRVAAAVVAGQSAEPILDELVRHRPESPTSAIQRDPKDPATITSHTCGDALNMISDPSCFLDASERADLIDRIEKRIMAAHQAFSLALAEVRFEEYLRPKQDPGWLAILCLEAITLLFSAGVAKIGSLIKSAAGRQVLAETLGSVDDPFRTVDSQPGTSTKLLSLIAAVPSKPAEKVVGAAVGIGKKEVASQLKVSAGGKAEALSFLDVLSTQSELMYQEVRENSPKAAAGDVGLVQLCIAWDIRNHSKVAYRTKIRDLLQSFKTAELDKLGEEHASMHRTNTRVLRWRTDLFSARRRLAMYEGSIVTHTPGDPRPSSEHVGAQFTAPIFDQYVPDDLVDAALAMHRAKFGSEPAEAT